MIPTLAQQLASAQSDMASFVAESKRGGTYRRKHAPRRVQKKGSNYANDKRAAEAEKIADRVEALIASGVNTRKEMIFRLRISEGQGTRALARLCDDERIEKIGFGIYAPGAKCKADKQGKS